MCLYEAYFLVLTFAPKHLAESYVRTRIAVIDLASDPVAAVDFILSPSTSSYMIQDTLYAVQTLMGDAFLVRSLTRVRLHFLKVVRFTVCMLCTRTTSVSSLSQASYTSGVQVRYIR